MAPQVRSIAALGGAWLAEFPIPAEFDGAMLSVAERAILASLTAPRRRAEWVAGRIAASAALTAAGAPPLSVLADPRGAPMLEGPGAEHFSVSITHGRTLAAALAARDDSPWPHVGLDRVDDADTARLDRLSARVYTAAEQTLFAADPALRRLAWGARESIAKATSTGMFVYALKAVQLVAVDRERVVTNLEGAELLFEAQAGGILVLAGVTRACRERAQEAARRAEADSHGS